MGTYWASRLGLNMRPDVPGSPVDRDQNIIDTINKLRDLRTAGSLSPQEESQALRSLGIPDARLLVDASPARWRQVQEVLETARRQNTQGHLSDSDDTALAKYLNETRNQERMKPVADYWNLFIKRVSDIGYETSTEQIPGSDKGKAPTGTTLPPGSRPGAYNNATLPRGNTQGSMSPSMDRILRLTKDVGEGGIFANLRAPKDTTPRSSQPATAGQGSNLTTTLYMLISVLMRTNDTLMARGGIYGGGDRAQSAIPNRIPGAMLHAYNVQKAIKLGAL